LRRQARRLENELDLKLVSFSKLGANYSQACGIENDKTPLLSTTSSEHMVETMAVEIEQLLTKVRSSSFDLHQLTFIISSSSIDLHHLIFFT